MSSVTRSSVTRLTGRHNVVKHAIRYSDGRFLSKKYKQKMTTAKMNDSGSNETVYIVIIVVILMKTKLLSQTRELLHMLNFLDRYQ